MGDGRSAQGRGVNRDHDAAGRLSHVGLHRGGLAGAAEADSIGAAPLYRPVTSRVPDPVLGAQLPAHSDEFTGSGAPTGWDWVRAAAANMAGGALVWPTQSAELFNNTNTASVLTRDAPSGDFVNEPVTMGTGAPAGPSVPDAHPGRRGRYGPGFSEGSAVALTQGE